jgi:release factor glutamine methyltransferase
MTTIGQLRRAVAARLREAGLEASDVEARALVRIALRLSPEEVILKDREAASEAEEKLLRDIVERRLNREPLAYIAGEKEFWSKPFFVSRDTLIPRPETELLVAAALALMAADRPYDVLDLGSGSGCILVSLLCERPLARGTGVEVHKGALAIARTNAERFGVANQSRWLEGEWRAARGERFDLIVSNPPYVPTADLMSLDPDVRDFEPKLALDGGVDGLSAYRQIAALLPELLTDQGVVFLEGGAGQASSIRDIVRESGLWPAVTVRDALGHERVIAAARSEARASKISEILLEYGGELAMFRAGN